MPSYAQSTHAPLNVTLRTLVDWCRCRQRARPEAGMRDHLHQTLVSPLIARVLADEAYYGDGAPTWPGAPTSKDAKEARKKHIKRLKRFSRQFPEAAKLAHNPGPLQTASPMHERRMPRMWASVPAVVRRRGQEPGEQRRVSRNSSPSALPSPTTARRKTSSTRSTPQDEAVRCQRRSRTPTVSPGW